MFRNDDISDGGRPVLVTAPTAPVLTRDEVKLHLRVDFDDDNDLIDGMIAAAVAMLDAPSAGNLGRALRPQTWELRLRSFNDHRHAVRPYNNPTAIPLPYPPLISVDSVKYLDPSGNDITLVLGTDYRVVGYGAPLARQAIMPLYGKSWPVTRVDDSSVRIRFTAGYQPAQANPATADELPAPIRSWLKLVIGSLYESRESFVIGAREVATELPPDIIGMIEAFRVY